MLPGRPPLHGDADGPAQQFAPTRLPAPVPDEQGVDLWGGGVGGVTASPWLHPPPLTTATNPLPNTESPRGALTSSSSNISSWLPEMMQNRGFQPGRS